jgi:Domain of unknown function (DUF5060)
MTGDAAGGGVSGREAGSPWIHDVLRTLALAFAVAVPRGASGAAPLPGGRTGGPSPAHVDLSGELEAWHRVTLTFVGPESSEDAPDNPFLDYRLTVVFSSGARSYVVPGFFAADGDAAESGATAGRRWRVHFAPDGPGTWRWTASFRHGPAVAVDGDPGAGEPLAFDGTSGSFDVTPTDETGRDHRGKGRLEYVGKRYLRFAGTGELFLKGGADSPENFLAYAGFDGGGRHRYAPHLGDFRSGDPTWRGGRGRGIIGALDYLAGEGMNSVYFLTMNVGGDGRDVWPWTAPDERTRYDCSKLDQWEIVFSHMDAVGLMLHLVQQETENDHLLDGGRLGPERKLYYRELVARFAHHLALVWNLGEENTNTDAERKAFATWIRSLDPYDHPIVVHTFPSRKDYDRTYEPLLGFAAFEGPSLQIAHVRDVHEETLRWVERSRSAGRPWFVSFDEVGPAALGVQPDDVDPGHDAIRRWGLWGHLMAGGAGVEWYFGSTEVGVEGRERQRIWWDLETEDWRTRARMWDETRVALDFFRSNLPFPEMEPMDSLVSGGEAWCLAKPGEVYAVYLPEGGSVTLDLGAARREYEVLWLDAKTGGALWRGSVERVRGPGVQALGSPPAAGRDFVALVRAR